MVAEKAAMEGIFSRGASPQPILNVASVKVSLLKSRLLESPPVFLPMCRAAATLEVESIVRRSRTEDTQEEARG